MSYQSEWTVSISSMSIWFEWTVSAPWHTGLSELYQSAPCHFGLSEPYQSAPSHVSLSELYQSAPCHIGLSELYWSACAAPSVHMTLSVMYSVQLCCPISPHDIISHVQCTTVLPHQYNCAAPSVHMTSSVIYYLLLLIAFIIYIALFSALEQTHCSHWHVLLNERLQPFIARVINIHRSGVLVAPVNVQCTTVLHHQSTWHYQSHTEYNCTHLTVPRGTLYTGFLVSSFEFSNAVTGRCYPVSTSQAYIPVNELYCNLCH